MLTNLMVSNITDQFISLVNPEKEIHPYVEKLTGISSKDA